MCAGACIHEQSARKNLQENDKDLIFVSARYDVSNNDLLWELFIFKNSSLYLKRVNALQGMLLLCYVI